MKLLLLFLMTLLELLKSDEKEALKQIFIRYQKDIMRFLTIKLSGNRELAEELYQETAISFIKSVAMKKHTFTEDGKIRSFLLTIAMNKLRDNYRKYKSRVKREYLFDDPVQLDIGLSAIEESGANPETDLLEKDQSLAIKSATSLAMTTLSDMHQQILNMKFEQNLSNIDIAKKMAISVKAVESLLFRAKKAFKKAFMKAAVNDKLYHFNEGGSYEKKKN